MGRSPVLAPLPPSGRRGRSENRGTNRGKERLSSSVFSEQKETEEAGDKAIAYYSEYVKMLGGEQKWAGGRERLRTERGTTAKELKEQWEWRQR